MAVPLLDRRLLFVTGKGGVGKTTVAAALGVLAARHGRRTLVCEVDAKGDLVEALEAGPASFRPVPAGRDLWAMAMDTEESLKEYLRVHLHLPLVTRIGPLARTLDFVASAAPGVHEILTVGKLCYEVREDHYDLVVVDASATGHIIGQLAAPDAINALVRVGMVRDQTRWMLDILHDPASTGVVIVASPEEMPVAEAVELAGRLDEATRVDLAAVVVNRVLPELFGRSEEALFEQLRVPPALTRLRAEVGPGVDAVLDAAELAVRMRRTGAEHLDVLRRALGDRVPVLYVPELFHRTPGRRSTNQVAQALAEELGH